MAEKDNSRTSNPLRKLNMDVKSIPTAQYLDQTVIPLLISGLSEIVKVRPSDPISWLADYLLKNNASPSASEPNTTQTQMN